jgi:hypothetical protein
VTRINDGEALDGGGKPIRFRKKIKTFYEYASGDDPHSFRVASESERNRHAVQLIIRLSGDYQEVEGDYSSSGLLTAPAPRWSTWV